MGGGLPLLLLSVLPPVIPRASWPSAAAAAAAGRADNSVSFSSQPKLNYRKSQPAIDLYNLCLNKRDENHGFLSRLKNFFGSRPSSRKASTMSIADPTGQSIAAALRMHVGMLAGLVPHGNRPLVLSCNTLNVPNPETKLRRESYAKSGPIIRIIDDEPSRSKYSSERSTPSTNKYVAEPETRVNFVLPTGHRKSMSQQNSSERIKGSPRFPHRIAPSAASLSALHGRRKASADSVFSLSGAFDEQRRFSHQNVSNQEKTRATLQSRWKSTEDAIPGPSGT